MGNLIGTIHRSLWKIKVTLQENWRCIKYHKDLKDNLQFQDKYHNGQRCFVIGNGPSLKPEDLDKIEQHGDVSFAANRIFKMFSETTWRPTYYAACDTTLYKNSKKDIEALSGAKFIPIDIYDRYVTKKEGFHVFSRVPFTYFNLPPKFSNRLDKRFGEGGTITYHLLQLAVSMGFTEIFLIGVDFSFSHGIGPDGKYFEDKTIKQDHFKNDKVNAETMPDLYMNLHAFQSAERFTRKHGVRIFNATRGGKLEVFERVDFDKLF